MTQAPPLTLDETREVLGRLGEDLVGQLVLVGGQALAFWVEYYADRFTPASPVNSRDIDFGGTRDAATAAATRLGGECVLPPLFDASPNAGLVEFSINGHARQIDFLRIVFGVDLLEVTEMAIGVPIADVTLRVMHPVHCLEARISNVGGLPGYRTPYALEQARASILCAHEYLRDRLGEPGGVRAVLNLNERIYRFAWGNPDAKVVLLDYGIDAFEAVLVDDRLPEMFRAVRYPNMRATLARRRDRWREIRTRG